MLIELVLLYYKKKYKTVEEKRENTRKYKY
jgi:hypothetical protein